MKPLTIPADAEHVVIDYLAPLLAAHGQDVTCGVNIPTTTWTSTTKAHVQVAWDGTPASFYPVMDRASVRVTAWAYTTTAAKALVGLCEGLLLSHPGSTEVGSIKPGTGTLPAQDPTTKAQLASISVRVNLNRTVLT